MAVLPGVGGFGVVAPWSDGVVGVRGVDGWAPPDIFCHKTKTKIAIIAQ